MYRLVRPSSVEAETPKPTNETVSPVYTVNPVYAIDRPGGGFESARTFDSASKHGVMHSRRAVLGLLGLIRFGVRGFADNGSAFSTRGLCAGSPFLLTTVV